MTGLLALAEREGVTVEWGNLGGALGRYSLAQRRIVLDASLRCEPALCRAVLAHELGHHFTRRYAADPGAWEAAARAWALRRLIPDASAKAAWRRAVKELAERHGVPASWAAARLLDVAT